MNESEVIRCLLNENTRESLALMNSYITGGFQLNSYMDVKLDYIINLDSKYPGIYEALRAKREI